MWQYANVPMNLTNRKATSLCPLRKPWCSLCLKSEILESKNHMKKQTFILLLVVAAFVSVLSLQAQSKVYPEWFLNAMNKKGLSSKYKLEPFIQPSFLIGDFNGDNMADCAALVVDKMTKKKGVLLIHAKTFEYFIFGAGKNFGSGSDDFKWLVKWNIYTHKSVMETQFNKESGDIIGGKKKLLARPAINVEDGETGGGMIYWDGKKYVWIQTGE
jgi:hypothetical protein